jgi:hypothetical protein
VDRALHWCLAAAEQAFERDDLDASIAAAQRGIRIGTSALLPNKPEPRVSMRCPASKRSRPDGSRSARRSPQPPHPLWPPSPSIDSLLWLFWKICGCAERNGLIRRVRLFCDTR